MVLSCSVCLELCVEILMPETPITSYQTWPLGLDLNTWLLKLLQASLFVSAPGKISIGEIFTHSVTGATGGRVCLRACRGLSTCLQNFNFVVKQGMPGRPFQAQTMRVAPHADGAHYDHF